MNVSEDIFAGFNSALRGGESAHCEFMQVGKGRDVGIVQIEVFESKISGGTAISSTTRDSFRVCEGMDVSALAPRVRARLKRTLTRKPPPPATHLNPKRHRRRACSPSTTRPRASTSRTCSSWSASSRASTTSRPSR